MINDKNDNYDTPDALWHGTFPGDVQSEEIQAALKFFHQEGFLPCHAQSSCGGNTLSVPYEFQTIFKCFSVNPSSKSFSREIASFKIILASSTYWRHLLSERLSLVPDLSWVCFREIAFFKIIFATPSYVSYVKGYHLCSIFREFVYQRWARSILRRCLLTQTRLAKKSKKTKYKKTSKNVYLSRPKKIKEDKI